ncbi:lytic transglycosylase domain-containing protein [Roseivivax sediminis]|uniref:Transglycosylase SLT domain-containing protein n=1 Tax=Roseivivax sediminis TaxID=936889 RepID=A0A1I1UKB8_9RHOB|nr:lytic transglycosylase domain-containing protein [Roseivivax sediminis]SFD70068.1 Transglycosylase SLT domain-containing protein [Roseivivax sediminis]
MRKTALALAIAALFGVAACGTQAPVIDDSEARSFAAQTPKLPLHPNETPELRQLINEYADRYGVPRPLVHRVIVRESTHRPWARNGPYYGLMQILPATARTMGFRGAPSDLLDAETNLKYAVKYLRGAWMVSDGSHDKAVGWYARGYYYEAKRRGMLVETGLRPG